MSILWSIVIGFIVGLTARLLMPGRDAMGFIFTTVLGVMGALTAQLLGQTMGFYYDGEPASFLASVVGAMVVLWIARVIQRRTTA